MSKLVSPTPEIIQTSAMKPRISKLPTSIHSPIRPSEKKEIVAKISTNASAIKAL